MNKRLFFASVVAGVLGCTSAGAEQYNYTAIVSLCSGTCASFAALDVGTQVSGTLIADTTAGGSFDDSNFESLTLELFNPAVPPSGPVGDAQTDNPIVLDSRLGMIASNGTFGTTDVTNNMSGGQLLIELLIPPFVANGAFLVFDLSTGNGQLCLFYAIAGCIPGATEAAKFNGQFVFIDPDGDLISFDEDNCNYTPNPDQRDTDGDGYGNACDPDLNNDCVVNFVDLGLFKSVLLTDNADADFNGDGVVDEIDLPLFPSYMFESPQFNSEFGICNPAARGEANE